MSNRRSERRRSKSEVDEEDVCYVEEKLISPDDGGGLSLPLLRLLSSIKLWIVSRSAHPHVKNAHGRTLSNQDVQTKHKLFDFSLAIKKGSKISNYISRKALRMCSDMSLRRRLGKSLTVCFSLGAEYSVCRDSVPARRFDLCIKSLLPR